MSLFLYNTATRQKEAFVPQGDLVKIYVCGITAYDYCHIGHARSAVIFDVLVRYLREQGYKVHFIRNFTDIDDKIINRALKEDRDWHEVGQTYMQAFHEDMDRLGVLRADEEPKATEFIEQIQSLCQKLIDAGKAYATPSGDVYFRVHSYPAYGQLSQQSLDDMRAGASARVGLNPEKEDALDFALWKAAKAGEPNFPSPWGPGRPGWHIECSAMTMPWIPLDIHGGGQDLIFPHHENEKAQTEACLNTTLARLWMHNGFVQINSEKMSKSLGNYKTIRDILESFLPETLRFFLLGKHYRSPIDFSFADMEEAERGERRIYQTILDVQKYRANPPKLVDLPKEQAETLRGEWQEISKRYAEAMNDDVNTAQALGVIFSLVRHVNRLLEEKKLRKSQVVWELLGQFLEAVELWRQHLGLFSLSPEDFFAQLKALRITRNKVDVQRVEELLNQRRQARAAKDFARSDSLRNELESLGVIVQDTPEGQKWDLA
ncbi:MAG: cysteine--tRNA ligase [Desulfovibrio sp.]|nr:cysteine--tRNA ligase [Desulfovibrio sp.]